MVYRFIRSLPSSDPSDKWHEIQVSVDSRMVPNETARHHQVFQLKKYNLRISKSMEEMIFPWDFHGFWLTKMILANAWLVGGWTNPIWKICSSNWIISPIFGMKIKNLWVATNQSGDSWMYPYQRTPMGNPYISPISTMGTLLGVHPIVPWKCLNVFKECVFSYVKYATEIFEVWLLMIQQDGWHESSRFGVY